MKKRLYFFFIRFFYVSVYILARGLAALLYRFEVKGRDNVPEEKNLLVVARHKSYLDPPLIGLALGIKNTVHFIAREGLLSNPIFSIPVRLFSTPIDRETFGKKDLRKILTALKRHDLVCILPEGTTQGEKVDPKTGAIKFAEKTGKKFLPVKFKSEDFPPSISAPFPKIVAEIGPAFGPEELKEEIDSNGSKDRYKELSKAMMKKIDLVGS